MNWRITLAFACLALLFASWLLAAELVTRDDLERWWGALKRKFR